MKKCKIKFKLHFSNSSAVNVTYTGAGKTKYHAETIAWQKMAEDNFKRNLILCTVKIEVIEKLFEHKMISK